MKTTGLCSLLDHYNECSSPLGCLPEAIDVIRKKSQSDIPEFKKEAFYRLSKL